MTITPDEFVVRLLEWDGDPPDAEYSPVEYASSVGQQLPVPEVQRAAALAVKLLPSSLAASALEGLYDSCPEAFTPADAMIWLSCGYDVNTGATVVRFMMECMSVVPDDAVDLLLKRLERESDPDVQNSLAYACWSIVNGRTFLVQEDKLVGCLFTPFDQRLEHVLALTTLSSYARETLTECKTHP